MLWYTFVRGTQLIKIRKFGKAHAGISIGDTILFRKVEVQEYNNSKKFLAEEIEILKKAETENAADEAIKPHKKRREDEKI